MDGEKEIVFMETTLSVCLDDEDIYEQLLEWHYGRIS